VFKQIKKKKERNALPKSKLNFDFGRASLSFFSWSRDNGGGGGNILKVKVVRFTVDHNRDRNGYSPGFLVFGLCEETIRFNSKILAVSGVCSLGMCTDSKIRPRMETREVVL